jgi:hypothetical protein
MAIRYASAVDGNLTNSANFTTDPSKYTSLDDFILRANNGYNKPEVRDALIKTYGDQGITGFLTLTGAVNNAGSSDQIEYFEEERRHKRLAVLTGATIAGTATGTQVTLGAGVLQAHDVVLDVTTGERYIVSASLGGITVGLKSLDGNTGAIIGNGASLAVIGNMYPQGSDQPTKFTEPQVKRRVNPFMIVKERFEVNGSQATNIGYINTGNGDYRWFMYGESEARKRFMDKREMMLLLGQTGMDESENMAGSEGYFSAIENRGNLYDVGGTFALTDVDNIIVEMDKQGAPTEYAMYLNRTLDLDVDDMLATGLGTGGMNNGLPTQFGAFNNSADMAVNLGFKSFTRGGYTFHKHSWKLLNDPALLAGGYFKGALVPMTKVADAKTGVKSPALEMNYKAANGYSREMNHWVTGGAVLGYTNNGDAGTDVATFHYRSEVNLITRAANQHFLFI